MVWEAKFRHEQHTMVYKAQSNKMLGACNDLLKSEVSSSSKPYSECHAVKEAIDKDVFRERAQTSR